MKKIIVINRSLGELDWLILNWAKIDSASDEIIILCYRCNLQQLYEYSPTFMRSFRGEVHEWSSLNSNFKYMLLIDNFMDRVSTKISNLWGGRSQWIVDVIFSLFRQCITRLPLKLGLPKSCVYHEYNARTSMPLVFLRQLASEFVFFPHHFNIESFPPENQLVFFKNFMKVEVRYLSNSLGGVRSPNTITVLPKKCLILTRQCSLAYGFNYEEAYDQLDLTCSLLTKLGISLVLKHHPREQRLNLWENLEQRYSARRIDSSAIDFAKSNVDIICVHLYTSLVNELSKFGIPCFDVSPYATVLNDNVVKAIQVQANLSISRRMKPHELFVLLSQSGN